MKLLAKYMTEPFFCENGMFRFTQPSSLNDPFDMKPTIIHGSYSDRDIENAYREAAEIGLDNISLDEVISHFLAPYPAYRFNETTVPSLWPCQEPRLRPEPFSTIAELDAAICEKLYKLYHATADKNVLIFSLTRHINSRKMWSDYANNNGVAVYFHEDHPFIQGRSYEVIYSREPPRISIMDGIIRLFGKTIPIESILSNNICFDELPLELLFTKCREWESEGEVRLIRPPKEATKLYGKDSKGNSVYLFQVPPEAIHSIVFGYEASPSAINETSRKIKKLRGWSNIPIFRQFLATTGFEQAEVS